MESARGLVPEPLSVVNKSLVLLMGPVDKLLGLVTSRECAQRVGLYITMSRSIARQTFQKDSSIC